MNFKKSVFFVLFIFFFNSVLSCETAADCRENEICVNGVCGQCNKENVGKLCSDDILNNYLKDGVCTFDLKCEETSFCLNSSFEKIFSSCAACNNGDKCVKDFQGKLEYDGVCLDGQCFSNYCVANSIGLIVQCGNLEEICSILNEEKSCDFVGDGDFKPENKTCYEGKCVEATKEEKTETTIEIVEREKKPEVKENDFFVLFVALFILDIFCCILFYNISNKFLLRKAKTTNQKRFVMLLTILVSAILFVVIFQIARIFWYWYALVASMSLILIMLTVFFLEKKASKEKKAIRVE